MPLKDCSDPSDFLPSNVDGPQVRTKHRKATAKAEKRLQSRNVNPSNSIYTPHMSSSPIKQTEPGSQDATDPGSQQEAPKIWQDTNMGMFQKSTIIKAQASDQFSSDLINYLEHGDLPPTTRRTRKVLIRENDYCVLEGILYHIWQPNVKKMDEVCIKLVVPASLQHKVLFNMHNSTVGAHTGMSKMIASMRSRFSWSGMVADIQCYISSCPECNLNEGGKRQDPPRTLYDLVHAPMVRISIDFCGPFECTTRQNRYICVVTDHFSGFTIGWPMKNIVTDKVARDVYDRVFTIHGCPTSIVSDRGPQFVSALWDEVCKIMNIRKCLSSAFHPKTNGSVESRNRSITELLRCICHDKPRKWDFF